MNPHHLPPWISQKISPLKTISSISCNLHGSELNPTYTHVCRHTQTHGHWTRRQCGWSVIAFSWAAAASVGLGLSVINTMLEFYWPVLVKCVGRQSESEWNAKKIPHSKHRRSRTERLRGKVKKGDRGQQAARLKFETLFQANQLKNCKQKGLTLWDYIAKNRLNFPYSKSHLQTLH